MNFVDEVCIHVRAGAGGSGCASFHREKYRARGAPDGGDGGRGGSVVLIADLRQPSLVDFRHVREWTAAAGERGGKDNRHGADGADLLIRVPVGTVVFYQETGEQLGDLIRPGQRLIVACGGEGGKGNHSFKSGVDRGSRKTIPGEDGEKAALRLEIRLPADVGLVGLPNAGKSSLLRAVSEARPRIGDYPFTTQSPQPGVACVEDTAGFESERFVVVDMPALIKGSSSGAGLGIRFLRHLGRARLLLHVIDASADVAQTVEGVRTVQAELAAARSSWTDRPVWFVLNKSDLAAPDHRQALRAALTAIANDRPCHTVSALNGDGCHPLCAAVAEFLAGSVEDARHGTAGA